MDINTLAIDSAKQVFQLCGVDKQGKIVKEKRVYRSKLLSTVSQLKVKRVVMEACGSANYWAREFIKLGLEVKLISPQYVKPYVKGNKNDKQDARGIAEAAQRPTMRFVAPKTVEQQDMQSLLRMRAGYVQIRTKLSNQTRGLLAEYGITISCGVHKLLAKLPELFDLGVDNNLTAQMKTWFKAHYNLLVSLSDQISQCDKDITHIARQHEACQRLVAIEGVGMITAVAIVAHIGNGSAFKNGRHLSAYLGLVPKQHSSGNKQQLQGISKRGDKQIRCLLIHGGRSVVRCVGKKTDDRSKWVKRIKEERGTNKASVAVGNKNARIILALLKSGEPYRKAA